MRPPPARWLLGALVLLVPPVAEAERLVHELIFDAEQRKLCQREPNQGDLVCDPKAFAPYPTGNAIALKLKGAPCTTAYLWRVDQREVAEVTPGVRGLEEVEGMLAGILAPPEAKGVVALEGVTIREQTVADLVARLHTLEGVEELEEELRDEAEALESALDRLERGREDYARLVCSIAIVAGLDCPGGEDRLADLLNDLEARRSDLDALLEDLEGRRAGTAGQQPADATCDAFHDRDLEVRKLLVRVRSLRQRIENSPEIASYPERLVGLADALRDRLDFFAAKLRRTAAAAEIARAVLSVVDVGTPRRSESFLQHLRRLRETYPGDDVSAGVLQELAEAYARVTLRRGGEARLLEALVALERETGTRSRELGEIETGRETLISSVRRADREFEHRVTRVNEVLSDTVEALVGLGGTLRRDRPSAGIGPWNANQVLTVSVFERPRFEMPDLSSLDQVRLPAGALDALVDEPPAADEGFTEVANGIFEVHKLYRYNVGIGIAASRLGEREFGVRGVTRLGPDGEAVLDDEGDPIVDPVVVETGRDDEDLEFPLLITYYFEPFDSFPGEAALQSHWGVSLGFGLDEPDENLFLGLSYQPTLGIQLIGGLHYGRRTALQDGIAAGDVLPAGTTEAPTRREWELEPFVSVTFDALVFKRLLAGAG